MTLSFFLSVLLLLCSALVTSSSTTAAAALGVSFFAMSIMNNESDHHHFYPPPANDDGQFPRQYRNLSCSAGLLWLLLWLLLWSLLLLVSGRRALCQVRREIERPRMRDRQIRKEVFKWMNYLKECLSFVSSL